MKKIPLLFVILAPLVLFGLGCSNPRADWPTQQQLSTWSNKERDQAVADFLKKHPPTYLTGDADKAEIKRADDLVLHKTIVELAYFEELSESAKGSARIVKDGDKQYLVFSEDFHVDAGPQLAVYLNDSLDPTVLGPQALQLGLLKSNDEAQVYDIPPGTDITKFRSVMIYDQPFQLMYGYATFK